MIKSKLRVGVVGAGTIGKAIVDELVGSDRANLVFVFDKLEQCRATLPDAAAEVFVSRLDIAMSRQADLIIEAAHSAVLSEFAPDALLRSDVCGFSCSALSNPEVEDAIQNASTKGGRRFYVPHGAALGLDGIRDGREALTSVAIRTTKSGPSLGLAADANGIMFEGTAREACKAFPRNANIHAAISLAGIGFDRTKSLVVAQPDKAENEHVVTAEGNGFNWTIQFSSVSLGGVTGGYTVISATNTVRRLLDSEGIVVI